MMRNAHGLVGLALLVGGTSLAGSAWLVIDYIPLVALGLAAVILGTVSIAISYSTPPILLDSSLLLSRVGLDNISSVVEELGLRAPALYLPRSHLDGPPQALIPLRDGVDSIAKRPLAHRLIVQFGPGPEDVGVLIATVGSSAIDLLDRPVGPELSDLEHALSSVLVSSLDVASSVRVWEDGGALTVEVDRPTLWHREHPIDEILGSPVAAIIATLAAESLDAPVRILNEFQASRRHSVQLQPIASG